MIHTQTLRRRSWAGLAWLSAVALSALIAAIIGSTAALLVAGSIVLAGIAGMIMLGVGTANRAPSGSARIVWAPVPQRSITTAEGTSQSALVVPIERNDGFEMVLTVEGYKLIDEVGQVVYTIKRP